jgi:two-component system, cell cycle sensor histidine kinase and response regulator CckA
MLINLALNARDAMPGGGTLRVEVESVQLEGGEDDLDPGRYVRVSVSDTGTGMTPEVAAHVFEPFFTTKPKGQGTGLGLATVYGVINEAGGAISVRSAPGKGSTFTIHLPAAFGAPIGLGESAVEEAAAQEAARRRVLVVEDDAAVRRVGCRILEGAGYEVLEAAAADEAVKILESIDGDVSLLLTDVVMPGASGWDLHTIVAERWPGVPTLFMSGYTDDLIGRQKLSGEGIDFIAKPFGSAELLTAVRAHAS